MKNKILGLVEETKKNLYIITHLKDTQEQISDLDKLSSDYRKKYYKELESNKLKDIMLKDKQEIMKAKIKQDKVIIAKQEIIKEYEGIIDQFKADIQESTDRLIKVQETLRKLSQESEAKESTIDSLQSKLRLLEDENNQLLKKVEFLTKNRRAPTREEIIAYECSQREVLKRQKKQK